MGNSAINVAKYIINLCSEDNNPISNIQLQKILFFVQREFLQVYKHPAFDDVIEAWKYGPVVSCVYRMYCGYGPLPINSTYSDIENEVSFSEDEIETLKSVVYKYREMPVWTLVELSHKKNGPWYKTYKDGEGAFDEISVDLIKNDAGN